MNPIEVIYIYPDGSKEHWASDELSYYRNPVSVSRQPPVRHGINRWLFNSERPLLENLMVIYLPKAAIAHAQHALASALQRVSRCRLLTFMD